MNKSTAYLLLQRLIHPIEKQLKGTEWLQCFFKDAQLTVIQVKKVGKDEHISDHPKEELDCMKRRPVM